MSALIKLQIISDQGYPRNFRNLAQGNAHLNEFLCALLFAGRVGMDGMDGCECIRKLH